MAVANGSAARRIAALLVALGGDLAAPLIRDLRQDQIEAITREIVAMETLTEDERDEAFEACYRGLTAPRAAQAHGADFAWDLLARTVGTRRAGELMARVAPADGGDKLFEFVRQTDMNQMVAYFQTEHPQTVALALAHMPRELAAQVLAALGPDVQGDVALRLARTTRASPDVLRDVEATMRRQLAVASTAGLQPAGGVDYLVEVLGACDSRAERSILEALRTADPELADRVSDRMFTFEDVAGLDDRSIQRLIREVDHRDLVLALRGATDELRRRVLGNMSSRSARNLESEIELIGPTRLRLIEEARGQIVLAARRLRESEEITVPRGREDVFVS